MTVSSDDLKEARQPIASLISKSEKAQQKLKPETWQHTMLSDNLKALQIAFALMNKGIHDADNFTRDDLQEAIRALAVMVIKTGKTRSQFSPGTSQHTLQRNRLKALRIAEALTKAELDAMPNKSPKPATVGAGSSVPQRGTGLAR